MKPQEVLKKISDLKSEVAKLHETLEAVLPSLSKARNRLCIIDNLVKDLRKNAQLELLRVWRIQYRKKETREGLYECML
jgi:hypothetical protein